MQSILKTCTPRSDILTGSFNPEIFTASLSEVIRFYSGKHTPISRIYTDAGIFFREATYPTDGMKMLLSDVFERLSGNSSVPAIHRLETAFGGGKTHSLIACIHIAQLGKNIREDLTNIIDPSILLEPGEISIAGIAGDEIPVMKTAGAELLPYTLWGEIAYQIGGEDLYSLVEAEASSYAAPGKHYFDKVFADRKVLLMLDELAQYAARFSAAVPGGGDQLAAFLMALNNYARMRPGMAVIITLASSADAFATQTENLVKILSEVKGTEISQDEALGIAQDAVKGIGSVTARDATSLVPVHSAEISRVLSKRLFSRIDTESSAQTASLYFDIYKKNSSILPDIASRSEYKDRMTACYPLHPTLIDFLNNKLSSCENFQGTRGVLRVLSLAVRNIWGRKMDIPMIHACHLDLKDAKTVNEIIGRTSGNHLLPVINADIGGADTESLFEGGKSNAEQADSENPHPEGWPMHVYAWKSVFLHSLAGSERGLESNIFGLTEQDAVLETSFPGFTPFQVLKALEKINESAFYLRFSNGKYYASLEPSENIVLAGIRRKITNAETDEFLDSTARKILRKDIKSFNIYDDVELPENIPDNKGIPCIAVIKLGAGKINPEEFIVSAGVNTPRIEQNLVFLLVPRTVSATIGIVKEENLLITELSDAEKTLNRLREIAKLVLAMRRLSEAPESYGIRPEKLKESEFQKRLRERELALQTSVTEAYRQLWFPSSTGQIACKEIKASGGEGGESFFNQIRSVLKDENELVTDETSPDAIKPLFFESSDFISISDIQKKFCRERKWPVPESPKTIAKIARDGVVKGLWCLFGLHEAGDDKPSEFYTKKTGGVALGTEIMTGDYSLITIEGAKKRGWIGTKKADPEKIAHLIRNEVSAQKEVGYKTIVEKVASATGVQEEVVKSTIENMIRKKEFLMYSDGSSEDGKPTDLITGEKAEFETPTDDHVIISSSEAKNRDWIADTHGQNQFDFDREKAPQFMNLIKKAGSMYGKGAKTEFALMDLYGLELKSGGTIRVSLENISPESMKSLDELFGSLVNITKCGQETFFSIEVKNTANNCNFMSELEKIKKTDID